MLRAVKRFSLSMLGLLWYMACILAAMTMALGPPALVIYVILHFVLKYW